MSIQPAKWRTDVISVPVKAEPYDDGINQRAYEAMKGKKVAFVPLSMGFDLTQGWGAAMQVQADAMGYELIIRDPNWSTDAGATWDAAARTTFPGYAQSIARTQSGAIACAQGVFAFVTV